MASRGVDGGSRRRPELMIRPATASSRSRSRLGSQRRAGWPVQGEGLRPDQQVGGQHGDLEPDLVLVEAVKGQVGQAGVFQAADAVLGSGALAVPDFQVRRADHPVVLVAKQVIRQPSSSVKRSCAPGWGRSRRAMTRIPAGQPRSVVGQIAGQLGDLGALAWCAVAVEGGSPGLAGHLGQVPRRSGACRRTRRCSAIPGR